VFRPVSVLRGTQPAEAYQVVPGHRGQVSALAVPYLELWYEDLLLDGDGSTLRKVEHFLDVGASRMERERGEAPTLFAVPTIPGHLAISKQTPHDFCVAVANYEAFCRAHSKDKRVAHFLVNPCGRASLGSAWDRGRCCRCDVSPAPRVEESLDKVLEEKLEKISAVSRLVDDAVVSNRACTSLRA